MKIWVLFSIANMYDQPINNMSAWWVNKPTCKTLGKVIVNATKVEIGKIYRGLEIQCRGDETTYRLENIEEGQLK